MVSEIWDIMHRFDGIVEVPEARFRGGRVRMQAIKCVVVGDGAVGEADSDNKVMGLGRNEYLAPII